MDRELPVAAVENVRLSKEELDMGLNSSLKSYTSHEILQYVNKWVDQELLFQEAIRQNILPTEDMEFELEKLRKAMLIDRFLKERIDNIISVNENEVEAYYEANKNEFMAESNSYKFEGIKTADNSFSNTILRELNNNESIITVYEQNREKCEILSTGRQFITEGLFPGPVANDFRNKTPARDFSRITVSGDIWIVRLIDRQDRNVPKQFESVRDEIYQKLLYTKKEEKYKELISRLRQNNKFEINLSVLVDSTSTR
ncbi:peptidyl-prolyl cis-trans isomerase [candidate division KSB1 bacterium]